MYSILDLNKKLVADLREITTVINVSGVEKLKKAELIEAILDEQKNNNQNGSSDKSSDGEPKKKRKRVRISKESNDENKINSNHDLQHQKSTPEEPVDSTEEEKHIKQEKNDSLDRKENSERREQKFERKDKHNVKDNNDRKPSEPL